MTQFEPQPEWFQPPLTLSDSTFNETVARPVKRHAACDECRKRKLKCSGEQTGCTRCLKQDLVCHYSEQKQMGRPPKKRLREEEDPSVLGLENRLWATEADLSHLLPIDPVGAGVPSGDVLQPGIGVYTPQTTPPAPLSDDTQSPPSRMDLATPLNCVPTTTTPWPDFSSVSAATASLTPLPPDLSYPSPDPTDSSDQQCSCLSRLYLCLSHLSSLAPFPISQHTFCSLYIAARTSREVIRCRICPRRFGTGMQNVMCTGTLLAVIADSWLRVYKANPVDLGKQSTSSAYAATIEQSPNPAAGWKDWLRQTVRGAVVGGPYDPAGSPQVTETPSLLALIEEMEARQRRWHQSSPLPPDERVLPVPTCEKDESEALCLRVIRSAREVIAKFRFEPCDYPQGTVPVTSSMM
ncbi:Zn(II)2Cys6 transcription factor rglT [Aspergillus saccharolyticus JOP 1030-1]|uniref:Zn(2)-C6 fungal-type domain-containing protein n=1 Tax=Aspergillus saccharolyticus JOP 1030-1 TaxID=1450539 RepID=A0A318Z134_9EURO|nr:hypothetical protein BP01DRAFT_419335 [Aspergillus saccharolyticus JOP 1030-1]PYH40619.1 hypothetical protein BP01DRAFT_419335 [Aspergillus saccharolyticus JOP 1030-1]